MIDLKLAQKSPETLAAALANRHSDVRVEDFARIDGLRRRLLAEVEELKSQRNKASGQVAAMKRQGQDASALVAELGKLSDRIKRLDAEADDGHVHIFAKAQHTD